VQLLRRETAETAELRVLLDHQLSTVRRMGILLGTLMVIAPLEIAALSLDLVHLPQEGIFCNCCGKRRW
jgi:hypothetical protein